MDWRRASAALLKGCFPHSLQLSDSRCCCVLELWKPSDAYQTPPAVQVVSWMLQGLFRSKVNCVVSGAVHTVPAQFCAMLYRSSIF